MTSDLDEQLGYDADHNDPSQFCEHGTFIGSWWGPDYLCGWCEMGVSVDEVHAVRAGQRRAEMEAIERDIEHLFGVIERAATNHRERARYLCCAVPYIAESDTVRRYQHLMEVCNGDVHGVPSQ